MAFSESQPGVLREPDGVTWISTRQFVTANEGDFKGGSRGFTVFNVDGSVAWDAGSSLEYAVARIGHTNDRRSDAKGNEPENAEFGRFGRTDYLFVASERSSVIAVQDLSTPNAPGSPPTRPSKVPIAAMARRFPGARCRAWPPRPRAASARAWPQPTAPECSSRLPVLALA